mmetsp:Transcript_1297/g.3164  ORF Transcript_1297/g.3164 Transcript_1297/m.3164 type:complete len:373 (+) Transcript_1297:215-1333(+)
MRVCDRETPGRCLATNVLIRFARSLVVFFFEEGDVQEDGGPDQDQLVGCLAPGGKGDVIRVAPEADLVGEAGPQLRDLGVRLAVRRLAPRDGFQREGISDQEGQPAALALLSAAPGPDADAPPAGIGPEKKLRVPVLVQHHKLGDEDALIANVAGLPEVPALPVHGPKVRKVSRAAAAVDRAGVGLFVHRHYVRRNLLRGEEGACRSRLDPAAVEVFRAERRRGSSGVVDELCFSAAREVAQAPLEESRFLVDPTADAGELEWVVDDRRRGRVGAVGGYLVVGGIQQHPVDRRGAAAFAVAHLRGLSDDDLVEPSQPIHRHACRSHRGVDPLVVVVVGGHGGFRLLLEVVLFLLMCSCCYIEVQWLADDDWV